MNAKRWLLLIGAAGVTAAATNCKDEEVRTYLRQDGPMFKYLDQLSIAVCELEVKHPPGLDPTKRICPGGPGDRKTPPVYPAP